MTYLPRFAGPIPELYDRHMGPVLFEPYARELASRIPSTAKKLLEVAAGTGRVTRHLLAALPADGELTATDLHEPMIAEGQRRVPADSRLHWQTADAMALGFGAAQFDAVVCQFGLMFVPDKLLALREMRRVLRPGGTLLLATWDDLARNPASKLLHELAFAELPADPPMFMRVPFSMPDTGELHALTEAAGFAGVRIETVAKTGEASSAGDLAIGFVRGNPLWNQLVERGIDADRFEQRVADALRRTFGDTPCRSPLSAHVVTAIA
jgi:ubiquinone/menaquinone biosynthesis C-methylase UbiE